MQADQRALLAVLGRLLRAAVVVLFLSVPLACAVVAVRFAPPSHVEIAGQPVAVKPVLGQDTSRIQGGALIRREHAHVGALGLDVGVDISADWNRLIPSDKQTRKYLIALWDDPRPEISRIQDAARAYLAQWSLIGLLSGAVASGGVAVLLRERRRRLAAYSPEQAAFVSAHNRRLRIGLIAAGVAGALALDGLGLATYLHHDHHVVTSSPVFRGTTLQGTEVNGLMSEVLPFLAILRPRDRFFDTVTANLELALSDRGDLRPHGDRMVFVLAEDFEDVNGMARQVGLTAKLLGADFIALSGDLTFAGKPIESYIIDTVDYYSDHTPVYFAPGLHDTSAIVDAARARGWNVADGHTHAAGGLTLLSLADPRISQVGDFGVGDVLRDPNVDLDRFVTDSITEACQTHPDFVLVHDHKLGQRIAASGCPGVAVLDGRSYQFVGPRPVRTTSGGQVYELTNGSAGGHVSTEPNPGDLQSPARFAILTYAPAHQHTRYAVVTVYPNASVTVTKRVGLHTPFAHATLPGGSGGSGGAGRSSSRPEPLLREPLAGRRR
ncbi:MAG: hypothetical protein WB797_04055 [Nocardioides sp.]